MGALVGISVFGGVSAVEVATVDISGAGVTGVKVLVGATVDTGVIGVADITGPSPVTLA
jgi:hypothetical protein